VSPAARAQRVRERRLRRTVARHRSCLPRLATGERRVLALRAGVGEQRPHSRAAVARITGWPRSRVLRLERQGLRRLRALGTCSTVAGAGLSAPAGGAGGPRQLAATVAAAGTAPAPQSPPKVLGEHRSGGSKPATAKKHHGIHLPRAPWETDSALVRGGLWTVLAFVLLALVPIVAGAALLDMRRKNRPY
jgi:hypothetical protein